MVKVDKRKWEMRPVQIFRDTDGEDVRCEMGRREDAGLPFDGLVGFVCQFFKLCDTDRAHGFEVAGFGMSDAEAMRNMRAAVRREIATGNYSRFDDDYNEIPRFRIGGSNG